MAHEKWPFGEGLVGFERAEVIEFYRLGGLHPVDIGDTFQADRYKIVRKLGHGSSSTVWLAQDIR